MDMVQKVYSKITIGILINISACVITTVCVYGAYLGGITTPFTHFFIDGIGIDLQFMSEDTKAVRHKYKSDNVWQRVDKFFTDIEETINNFCTTSFLWAESVNGASEKINRILKNEAFANGTIYPFKNESVDDTAEAIENLNNFLGNKGIEFIYVQLPGTKRIGGLDGTEAADLFADLMEKSNVEYINISKNVPDVQKYSLDGCAHWFSRDALESTRVVVDKIIENTHVNIDRELYLDDHYYDLLNDNGDVREEIKKECGYDYELLVPKMQCNYFVEIDERSSIQGDFNCALILDKDEWNRKATNGHVIAYHNIWRVNNFSLFHIENMDIDNEGKLLVLGDSFSWPMSSYLSQSFKEIMVLHPAHFEGSIHKVITTFKPDLVLMLYQEGSIGSNFNTFYGGLNK